MKHIELTSNNIFDIVIPVGPNDNDIIYKQIEFTKKNIIGYRNIYLICYDPNIIIDGCITINENIFPFSLETVSNIHGQLSRNGWYLTAIPFFETNRIY
jgi:flavorubredoxin